MIGLIYPGVSRLVYSIDYEGRYFPVHIKNNRDADTAGWLEDNIRVIAVALRPDGYNPLEEKNLDRKEPPKRDCPKEAAPSFGGIKAYLYKGP